MKSSYYKIATFFSRAQQEAVLQEIERSFYKAIAPKTGARKNLQKLRAISEQINFCVSNYYFEKDLLDYLLSFDAFISQDKPFQDPKSLPERDSAL